MKKHTLLAFTLAIALVGSNATAFPAVAADTNSAEPAADWIEGEAIVLTSGMPLLQGGTASTEETVVHTAIFDLQLKTGIEELPLLGQHFCFLGAFGNRNHGRTDCTAGTAAQCHLCRAKLENRNLFHHGLSGFTLGIRECRTKRRYTGSGYERRSTGGYPYRDGDSDCRCRYGH